MPSMRQSRSYLTSSRSMSPTTRRSRRPPLGLSSATPTSTCSSTTLVLRETGSPRPTRRSSTYGGYISGRCRYRCAVTVETASRQGRRPPSGSRRTEKPRAPRAHGKERTVSPVANRGHGPHGSERSLFSATRREVTTTQSRNDANATFWISGRAKNPRPVCQAKKFARASKSVDVARDLAALPPWLPIALMVAPNATIPRSPAASIAQSCNGVPRRGVTTADASPADRTSCPRRRAS
jgi:hypothetical protein